MLAVLKTDGRFFSEDGTLLRNAVYEAAMQMDRALIKLLFENQSTRSRFFTDVDGVYVFDKIGFGWVINNREFLPDCYTRYKNKIGLTGGGNYLSASNDVELVFPYKDCVLEGGQTKEDQRRDEIFYNATLAPDEVDRLLCPKVFTGAVRYDEQGGRAADALLPEDNLIVRGNNLLALASLAERYENGVQFIYIDPPYNTSNDSFRYNDTFKRSSWLVFMKNRLLYAKKLLTESGVIAIQINYKEYAYLKVLCDEIFGEGNYLNTVTVKTATTASYRAINSCPVNVSEFILLYAKNKPAAKIIPAYTAAEYSEDYGSYIKNIHEPYENWQIVSVDSMIYETEGVSTWQEFRQMYGEKWKEIRYRKKAEFCLAHNEAVISLNTLQKPSKEIVKTLEMSQRMRGKVIKQGNLYFYNGRSLAFYSKKIKKINGKLTPTEIVTNIWTDISFLSLGTEGGVDLPNGKKPELLLQRLIGIFTDPGDTVLDFYLGTGTTCAVAHKMGRRYLGIEQLSYGENDCLVRLNRVIAGEKGGISESVNWRGGGSFVYCELAKLNQKYVERIQTAGEDDLSSIWEEMQKTGFISSKIDPKGVDLSAAACRTLSLEERRRLLMELLDLNQLYLNYCDIDDETFGVSDADKAFTKHFYGDRS